MNPFQRKERIMEQLMNGGGFTIKECAALLGVSYATLQRDLLDMEGEGLIKRVRGGAVLVSSFQQETLFDIRLKSMISAKEEIAKKASNIIKDNTSIFLDHSTSAIYLARELKKRNFRNLTVVTNSLAIPSEFQSATGIHLIVTGGVVVHEFQALAGNWVIEFLKHLNICQIFASVGAISVSNGLATEIPFVHELLPNLFRYGEQINILADHTKFFKIHTFHIRNLDSSLTIFTDKRLPQSVRIDIEKEGPIIKI